MKDELNGTHTHGLVGPWAELVFIDFDNLSDDEKNAIIKMSGGWTYGNQVILQSEFMKKPQDAR